MNTRFFCILSLAAIFGIGCAGTPEGGPDPGPSPTSGATPGVPVKIPGLEDPVKASRPGTSFTDLRTRKAKPAQTRRAKPVLAQAFWLGGGTEKRRVIISLSHQIAQVWAGDELIGQSPVSTGKEGSNTPPGQYSIVDKRREHYSSLYGEFMDASGRHVGLARAGQKPPAGTRYAPSPMPYFMRMTWSGIGMHEGYLPGWPASHGCIRLPRAMAETFFAELPKGTPVEIIP
jgi:lipoprotein-anchoring transpeptidase ErfK/SrfK